MLPTRSLRQNVSPYRTGVRLSCRSLLLLLIKRGSEFVLIFVATFFSISAKWREPCAKLFCNCLLRCHSLMTRKFNYKSACLPIANSPLQITSHLIATFVYRKKKRNPLQKGMIRTVGEAVLSLSPIHGGEDNKLGSARY